MSTSDRTIPTRREPPPFRRVEVAAVERLSPRMAAVTLAGPELEGLSIEEPAASVRLLLPPQGEAELVVPEWSGNEFLLPGGERPVIRTFTPRHVDPAARQLVLWIVVHGDGTASEWAEGARPGAPAAVSGPGRGYTIDDDTPNHLLAGDETAIAAISQLLETIPSHASIDAHIEVAHADARLELPAHTGATIRWHDLPPGAPPGDALVAAVEQAHVDDTTQVWAAGEAAAMQRIRKDLKARGLGRSQTTVRGYWKHGRAGT